MTIPNESQGRRPEHAHASEPVDARSEGIWWVFFIAPVSFVIALAIVCMYPP